MAGFNGKWKLVSSENTEAYCAAVKAPEEFKAQILALAAEHKTNPDVYMEELKVDKAAGTVQRIIYVRGEVMMDCGVQKLGVESVGPIHGKEAKLTAILESDTKILHKEVGTDFQSQTVLEVLGDKLTVTQKCGDVVATDKYVRV